METDRMDSPSLPGLFSSLLSNPEMLAKLQQTLSTLQENAGKAEGGEENPPEAVSPPRIDGLSSLLGSSEWMDRLPQMMEAVRPILSSMPPPKQGGPKNAEDCRNDLLCALKPFLSPGRRDAIDTILQVSRLGGVLKQMK